MKRARILVLGNDPQINRIDFSRLSKDIITLGVNRIWLKHIPKYLFFNDYTIVDELNASPEILEKVKANSTIFSSDWLHQAKKPIPPWVKVYDRTAKYHFPDSVTTGMQLFSRYFVERNRCTFYIAGTSLIWQEPSHFWKELDHKSTNRHGDKWYSPRFERINHNFKQLTNTGFEMISVNPNSILNKMMRYENIENLYRKS